MEPGRAVVRDALRSAALQGGERRGDEGQHRQRQVQVRVALQGGHHGGHQAAHVDLQEGAMVSEWQERIFGCGESSKTCVISGLSSPVKSAENLLVMCIASSLLPL